MHALHHSRKKYHAPKPALAAAPAVLLGLLAMALLMTACRTDAGMNSAATKPKSALSPALESITATGLLRHIQVLASDEFEGRAPGSRGEELTVRYLIEQFKQIGLEPGNPDGTYIQNVPLIGFRGQPSASFAIDGKTLDLKFPEDYVAVSRHFQPEVAVKNSDVIFVGYGVVAPEYHWDDYKGFDVSGKTIVMLVNDPPVPDPADPRQLDEKMFKGRAMTYYGRWTYKYEIASEKGAAAAMIVHETGPAGYPYEVVQGSFGRENFDIKNEEKSPRRVAVESWITLERAKELFAACGKDFAALKQAAVRPDFKPVVLGAKASFTVKNNLREIRSRNVMGRFEGSDLRLKNEYVIYTAHWDHLGRDENLRGDQIYNGAVDNASGTAALLELARAFRNASPRPKRSILFLSVTAEEKGLLGSKYYATHPLYPLARTLADINIDGVNQWGRTKDIISVGFGTTTLDEVLAREAAAQGRIVKPDAEPEKGFFYRSDHFEFAKEGVPSLDPDSGVEYLGKPVEYGRQKREEYTAHDYHKVSDEVKPDWDLAGAVEDLQLLFRVGYRVAEGSKFPEWKPGTEFKARREHMLKMTH